MAKRGAKTKAASPSGKKRKSNARWAKNTKNATERAAATAKGLSKAEREKIVKETKEKAKKRQRIRDVGQDIPEGYLRRQGADYFIRKENWRLDHDRNTRKQVEFYEANLARMRKTDGWIDKMSKAGQLHVDGTGNFRKMTAARKEMDKAHAYHAGANRRTSRYSMIFGADGKAP